MSYLSPFCGRCCCCFTTSIAFVTGIVVVFLNALIVIAMTYALVVTGYCYCCFVVVVVIAIAAIVIGIVLVVFVVAIYVLATILCFPSPLLNLSFTRAGGNDQHLTTKSNTPYRLTMCGMSKDTITRLDATPPPPLLPPIPPSLSPSPPKPLPEDDARVASKGSGGGA